MSDPFVIIAPKGERKPLLLSVPHCGVEFPPELVLRLKPHFVGNPEDTDWFVHELYDFAPEMGITMIHARYSRYVIDLNRDPQQRPLYTDGRKETSLVPVMSFAGQALYEGPGPSTEEIARRRELYFDPYHKKIESCLKDLRSQFPSVLIYDAHSIARFVPTIRPLPFPDLILGDCDGKTAHPALRESALRALGRGGAYKVSVNDPFKGGYITRHYGRPEAGIHSLQLERSQDIYMDAKGRLDSAKTEKLREVLRSVLEGLLATVGRLG